MTGWAQRVAEETEEHSIALEAVLKDAERYRALRAWAGSPNRGAMQGYAHVIIPGKYGVRPATSGDDLDAAIDAAMGGER